VERAELSTHLSLERVDPVATASGPVGEQTSREGERDQPRHRRAPLTDEAAPELTGVVGEGIEAGSERPPVDPPGDRGEDRPEDRPGDRPGDRPEHRIDSLA